MVSFAARQTRDHKLDLCDTFKTLSVRSDTESESDSPPGQSLEEVTKAAHDDSLSTGRPWGQVHDFVIGM